MNTFDKEQQDRQLRYLWETIRDEQAELLNLAHWPQDEQQSECISLVERSIERASERIMAIHMVG